MLSHKNETMLSLLFLWILPNNKYINFEKDKEKFYLKNPFTEIKVFSES